MASRNQVNLDALIPREDLSAPAESGADIPGLKINDLKPGLIYSWLRKPDFQRETAAWEPEQVAGLIETFANGNIIPAIILWQNGQRVFVIDGAHRLSALIAWAQDDYGAGKLSAEFYQNSIPEHQRVMHDAAKRLVEQKVGSFSSHELAAQFQKSDDPALLKRASMIGFKGIDVQWIKNADVNQARKAFFRINQGGTEIGATETRILRARNSALAIASRAVARSGTGHTYWQKFETHFRKEIESLGASLHHLLFRPALQVPIKTLDVSLAGFGYGADVLPFAFDLISATNDLKIVDSSVKRKDVDDGLEDDPTGGQTIELLKKAKRGVDLLLSVDPSSLGLHPALYFYTSSGSFQPTALVNVYTWVRQLDSEGRIVEFIKVRKSFEQMILEHPVLGKPASHRLGSGVRTKRRTVTLYENMLQKLSSDLQPNEVWNAIITEKDFAFLAIDDEGRQQKKAEGIDGKGFSRAVKSGAFLEGALPSAPRCALCGGLLHMNAIVSDHNDDKSQGGSSAGINARPVHPRCNSEKAKLNEKTGAA